MKDEVAIALDVFGEEQEMLVASGLGAFAIGASCGRDVDLAADDGFDAALLAGLGELQRAEKVAVVRQRDLIHAERLDAIHQRTKPTGAVQQAKLAVQMEMAELVLGGHGRHSIRAVEANRLPAKLAQEGGSPKERREDE